MDNFTGSFGSRTFNMADEYADDHEESRNWETGTDLPESQFVPQPPFNRNPVFPDEIPDSQEDPRNEVRNSAEDDLEYDLDDYHTTPTDDNDGFNGPEAGHNGQVFPTEIPDSQQDPADYISDNGTGNDLDELSTEVPSDSPGNERQLQAFNFFNNALGVATLSGSSRVFRDEIPDTQEDFQDLSLEDDIDEVLTVRDSQEESNPGGEANTDEEDFNAEDTYHGHEINAGEGNPVETTSVHTEATEIIPGGTQPTHRISLHDEGIDRNGRLPSEHHKYQDTGMDDQATQPTTQPQDDTRRHGSNSRLSKQDETDVVVLLHPSSPAAFVAVDLTADAAPQHIQQNHDQSYIEDTSDTELEGTSITSKNAKDIALRLSSRVNDIRMGFIFGRNTSRSDILLVRDIPKGTVEPDPRFAVSNKHFRIYVNHNGIVMLEDISTNGTIVDNIVLHGPKAPDQSANHQPKTTLAQGSVIEVPISGGGDSIRFIVGLPDRYEGSKKYGENLGEYLSCVQQAERKAAAIAKAVAKKEKVPSDVPAVTNALPSVLRRAPTPLSSTLITGVGGNNFGLNWNGGGKYNIVGKIGSGTFATVYRVSSKRDGEVYAAKHLEKQRAFKDGMIDRKFYNELNIMKRTHHPHIIEYKEHFETDDALYIIMEYMPKGDLRLWTDRIEIMNDELAARVARQMLDAISFLHERGITHRDIKPDNILVAGDHADDKIFKLADFGLSKEVITEQTFMQTFCGTLLYLAPEVYPGFERAKAGLPLASTKRKRTSPERPYEHSVDIWSLGVVLYHALAGKPPFPSNQYTGGELFLDIVMAVRVDYEFLIWCGVGKEAIDFLKRMIVVDAQFRAHESDLMTHPFLLKKFPSGKGTPNEAQDLDASQLSLADDNEDEEGKDDPRKTKRIRSEIWTEQHDDLPESFRAEMSEMLPGGLHRSYFEPRRTEPSWRLSWGPPPPRSPSVLWPGLREAREAREREARNTDQSAQPEHPERLFGEIGSSALRSSGVLGQDANLALEVPMEVGSDDGNEVGSFIDPGGPSNHTSAGTTELNTSLSGANVRSQQNIQYPELSSNIPHNSAAPSLLGAEALVGQLNMTSPESRASAPSVGSKPATPKTPLSPNASNVEHHSQDLNTAAGENEKRHPETTTTPSLGHTQNPSAASMAEHRSSASKASSGASMNANTARHESPVAGSKSKQSTQESSEQHHEDGQQTRGSMKSNSPATASNSQDFAPKPTTSVTDSRTAFQSQGKSTAPKPPTTVTDSKTTSQSKDKSASQSKGKSPAPPPSPTPSIHPTLNLAPPTITTPSGFLLPTPRFGNLILTKPSMPSVRQIKITSMGTSFGRNPDCTYVHPNIDDRRVPKNAFDIQMWYPGIDRDLAKGKDDWAGNKELTAVISTRTAIYIKVNGVRLMKGRDCWLFGRLRTGDIVSVVELPEGQIAQNASDREVLQFRCEFFIGKSKSVRKEGEAFVVEMEDRKGVRTQGEAAAEGAGEKKGV